MVTKYDFMVIKYHLSSLPFEAFAVACSSKHTLHKTKQKTSSAPDRCLDPALTDARRAESLTWRIHQTRRDSQHGHSAHHSRQQETKGRHLVPEVEKRERWGSSSVVFVVWWLRRVSHLFVSVLLP
jgi:hypothetical protein